MIRGFLQRCPSCGKGRLFRSYLKQVDACADCGEAFADIRADDGPAWLTVMVTGHVVVALMMMVESLLTMPLWASIAAFSAISGAMVLGLLQRAKGIFIGLIWHTKASEAISAPAN
ncbi:MAG: DUF983 domain-containing protein [Proteobacteria bacterium]|nr:DUF983 domain-containing protein [Pseudomonadota bacterium]